ncbi:MAG: LytTR family DNA-binding domain-containing protein [Lacrimispora sp.]|uniref:LytTR family DNA-binding domain-containing protein n=1 Tax=Lacrimispora sp. TaxID=2719234 RepID=UPI0039E40112
MKVEIKLSPEVREDYAVIYCKEITDEVQELSSLIEAGERIVTAKDQERIVVLRPKEIFMVRVENGETVIYCRSRKYTTSKRLYELEEQLSTRFMRISKSAIVNLNELDSVEASFNSMMTLILKNGCKDYISRKYLPDFKKYLGL